MCFSATASFTAAAALAAVGAYALWTAPAARAMPFRAIPLVFAAHQFTEGLLWRAWSVRTGWRLESVLVRAWLLVALAVWPALMPAACALLEPRSPRRRAMTGLAIAGVALGAWLFTHAIARGPWSCVVRGHFYHAVQIVPVMQAPMHALYLLCVLAPLALSTARGARALGVSMAVAWVASAWIYRAEVISVWCFFAAWLSVMVARVQMPGAAVAGRILPPPPGHRCDDSSATTRTNVPVSAE